MEDAFKKWLETEARETRGGTIPTNKDFVEKIWSNPCMIEHAKTMFAAGYQAGLDRSKYIMKAASDAIT